MKTTTTAASFRAAVLGWGWEQNKVYFVARAPAKFVARTPSCQWLRRSGTAARGFVEGKGFSLAN